MWSCLESCWTSVWLQYLLQKLQVYLLWIVSLLILSSSSAFSNQVLKHSHLILKTFADNLRLLLSQICLDAFSHFLCNSSLLLSSSSLNQEFSNHHLIILSSSADSWLCSIVETQVYTLNVDLLSLLSIETICQSCYVIFIEDWEYSTLYMLSLLHEFNMTSRLQNNSWLTSVFL